MHPSNRNSPPLSKSTNMLKYCKPFHISVPVNRCFCHIGLCLYTPRDWFYSIFVSLDYTIIANCMKTVVRWPAIPTLSWELPAAGHDL